ncbi:MAG: helicase-related protein, partial [Promethearchaeota archaeon]
PICKKKLRIGSTGGLYCEDHKFFPWIKVTRESISNSNVDILISNPESIDFLLISPLEEKKRVLGEIPSNYPLKYIVFDEIHIWNGISGAGLKLFIERLKNFYIKNNPQVILLSATVKNPEKLIKSITTSKNFEAIEYVPERINGDFNVDFNKLKPCTFEDLMYVYYYIYFISPNIENLNYLTNNYEHILQNLILLDLIQINENGKIILKNDILLFENLINSNEVIEDRNKFKEFINFLIENFEFKDRWRNLILKKIPEIPYLINLVSQRKKYAINFITLDELKQLLQEKSNTLNITNENISMYLNFGRIADLLTDRYHIFIKPKEKIFWCKKCLILQDKEQCECGEPTYELKFCKKCHEVFYIDSRSSETSKNKIKSVYYEINNLDHCPGCGKSITNLYDIGVPYNTLISYLISAVCRLNNSQKILIFSDGRASAEKIANNIIKYDYSLVAERIFLKILLESDGVKNSKDIYFEMIKRISKYYSDFYKKDELDYISEEIINGFFRQNLKPLANITEMFHSFEYALVTAKCLDELADNYDVILGHEIVKMFTININNLKFTKNKVKFKFRAKPGYPIERALNKLNKKFKNLNLEDIKIRLYRIFWLLLKNNVISEIYNQEIEDLLSRQKGLENEKINEIRDYISIERENFQNYLIGINSNLKCKSGLFTRDLIQDDFDIKIVNKAYYCLNCYSSYPLKDEKLDKCPVCGSIKIIIGSRIEKINSNGNTFFKGLGYFKIDSNWKFNLDHWAYELLAKALDEYIKKVAIAVHRAGIPYSLRGIIEESFRKNPPLINAISSTPTLELGIDIGSLDSLCLTGIPPLLTNYVQRSGRTGRIIGTSSFVFNIIRNKHAIDNYYFNNLDSYFKDFKPLFIPNPKDFDIVYASHILCVICTYLARNPDQQNTYYKIFKIPESYQNVRNYYKRVITHLKCLIKLCITEKKNEIECLLRDNYGEHSVTIFNRLFNDKNNDLFLLKIANSFFGMLNKIDADQTAINKFTELYKS